jgi:hypothetical protein
MTKIHVSLNFKDATEEEAIQAIIDDGGFKCARGIDKLVEDIISDGDTPEESTIFVFEIVDKGKIVSKHSFVSSKKTKEK